MKDLENEIWKDIDDYEGLYQVSNKSRFRSFIYGKAKLMKKHKCRGYFDIRLSKNTKVETIYTHILIAKAFVPNPDNLPIVDHKNDNKSDDSVDNLQWTNFSKNVAKGHYSSNRSQIVKVNKYDLKGNFIESFDSIALAKKTIKDSVRATGIDQNLNNRSETAYGFIWKYAE